MELGGKDAAVLLEPPGGVGAMVGVLMRGVFQSAGQNCIGIERVVCLPRVYERVVEVLRGRVAALRVGSALDDGDGEVDVGAMISDAGFERLEALVREAVVAGARLLVGGSRFVHPKWPRGHYFQPTLLVDVRPEMRVAQEEVFGPVCVVMRARDVDDAIRIANSTPYALGASVFGRDRREIEKVVGGVKAGMVSVNDFAVYYAVQLPFGGVKGSGYGRFAGEEGLRSICNTKAVTRDWIPGVRTTIPRRLDYPIREAQKAWEVCQGVVGLGYGEGVMGKVKGLWKVIVNS